MLIIFGGLPGVGKTTISRKLAKAIDAIHLRIDTIETAIINSSLNVREADDAGYLVAYGIAKDNLLIGRIVIADSVNPIKVTRDAWREIAKLSGKDFIEIEIICSDTKEHQKRIETRIQDIKGQKLPTWQETVNRQYEDWEYKGIRIDSSTHTVDQSIEMIENFLSRFRSYA
jgi:predicted kinase